MSPLAGYFESLMDSTLELIFPARCGGCDLPGTLLCDQCRSHMPFIERDSACVSCGAPYGSLTCTECWQTEFAFSAAVALGSLERPLSRMVTLHKDGGERRYAGMLGSLLGEASERAFGSGWACAVTSVPPTQSAIRRRGFDHVYPLAAEAARVMGVPCRPLLVSRGASDLRRLGREARRIEVLEAFAVRGGVEVPAKVLVVDDVMTTGATLDAVAARLLAAGADEVRAAVLARAW